MATRSNSLWRTASLPASILVLAVFVAPHLGQASEENAATREPIVASRPGSHEPAPEYHLAYRFRANQDVRMLMVTGSQIRLQKGDYVELNTIQSVIERHYHVASVDPDGSAVLDLTIDNVKIANSKNGAPPAVYDTRDPAAPPSEFERVKECIGRHSQVKVNVQGKVSTLVGLQPAATDDPDFLVILPEKPVRIGDDWFDDYQVRVQVKKELSQRVTLRRRYTLTAVNNNVAVIRMETAEVTPVNDPQILAGMVQLTPKGTILMDLGQGALTLRDLRCSRIEVGVLGPASSIAGVSNTRETLR
jgi:hypothetical protein